MSPSGPRPSRRVERASGQFRAERASGQFRAERASGRGRAERASGRGRAERASGQFRTGAGTPGPGRGRGSAARTSSSRPRAGAGEAEDAADIGRGTRHRRSSLTTRALALGVVLLVLIISYASSLRVYFDQRGDIADTKVAITQHRQSISDLQTELARWQDPAYVKSQARERLGWVVPGETGYKVIGPDGKPVGPGAQINGANRPADTESEAWWAKLVGTMEAADHPAPGQQSGPTTAPSSAPTVGPSSQPTKR